MKIIRHAKNQESIVHSQEKIKTTPEQVQTLDLLDKDFKPIVLNMLKELRKTMNKDSRKSRSQYINKIRASKKI